MGSQTCMATILQSSSQAPVASATLLILSARHHPKDVSTGLTAHLDLSVATIQEADGQANALLEDLLIFGAGDEIAHQLGGPLLVQPALGGCDC